MNVAVRHVSFRGNVLTAFSLFFRKKQSVFCHLSASAKPKTMKPKGNFSVKRFRYVGKKMYFCTVITKHAWLTCCIVVLLFSCLT